MNIKMYKSKTDGSYSFKIYRDRKPIIIGNNFPSREVCLSNIESVLQGIRSNNMINIRSKEGGGYLFSVSHADSCVFKSLDQASDGLAFLKEAVTKNQELFVSIDSEKERIVSKKMAGQVGEGYNFKHTSKTKQPGFELIDDDKSKLFYFHYNDADGTPLFYSRAYDGKTRRIKAARNLTELCKDKKIKKEIVALKGRSGVVIVLKSIEDIEIARSKIFKNKAQASNVFAQFKKEVSGKIKDLKLPKKRKKKKKAKLPKNIFNLKAIAPSKKVGFVSFKSPENKCHYFHFQDKEGSTLLYSAAFTSRKKRDSAIEIAIKLSPQKPLYAITSKGKKHFFILQDEAGKGIAKSRMFATQKKMIDGMRYFHANAGAYADKRNVIVEKTTERIPLNLNQPKSKTSAPKSPPETSPTKEQINTSIPVKAAASPSPSEKIPTTQAPKKGQKPQPRQKQQGPETPPKGKPTPSKQAITNTPKPSQQAPKTSRPPQVKHPTTNKPQSANAATEKNTNTNRRDNRGANKEPNKGREINRDKENNRDTTKGRESNRAKESSKDKEVNRDNSRENAKSRNTHRNRNANKEAAKGRETNESQENREGKGSRDRNYRDKRERNQGETTNRQRGSRNAPLKEIPETKRASTGITPRRVPNKVFKPDPPKILPKGETPIPRFPWWKLLVSMIIGLVLIYGLFRACSGETEGISSNAPISVEKAKKEEVSVKEAPAVEKLPTLLGPTSTELGFAEGSAAAKIANFLSLPASVLPKRFLLDKVHFPTNQETFHQEAYDQLDRVTKLLLAYPKAIVQINGHTDNIGQPARNLQLSQERATFVRDYLVKNGLPASRITAKGYGDIEPIANNDTEVGRQANRRSEIVLLKR